MFTNLKIAWDSTYAVNSSIEIRLFDDETNAKLFSSEVDVTNELFYYSLPSYYFDYTEGINNLLCFLYTHSNGDSSVIVHLNSIAVVQDYTGQSHVGTPHSATVSGAVLDLTTMHSVFIDRSSYSGGRSYIFWDSDDTTEVSGSVTDASYIYDGESKTTFALMDTSSSGNLKIFRTTDFTSGGVDGTVHVKAGIYGASVTDVSLYLDITHSPSSTGTSLGKISKERIAQKAGVEFTYQIPAEQMLELSDSLFNQCTLNINYYGEKQDSTILIYDSYITMLPTTGAQLDTSHSAYVAAYGEPILSKPIQTYHSAKIKSGKAVIIDYYTPSSFWDYGNGDKYNTNKWNTLESISQDLGRFYHSPILFNVVTPYIGEIKYTYAHDGTISVTSFIGDSSVLINDFTDGTVSGVCFTPSVSTYLDVYNPVLSPDVVVYDSTIWNIHSYTNDTTIFVYLSYFDTSEIVGWSDTSLSHPFTSDVSCNITFYGRV